MDIPAVLYRTVRDVRIRPIPTLVIHLANDLSLPIDVLWGIIALCLFTHINSSVGDRKERSVQENTTIPWADEFDSSRVLPTMSRNWPA